MTGNQTSKNKLNLLLGKYMTNILTLNKFKNLEERGRKNIIKE